jgi:tetratricopeptide (TPR) repeat protein
MKALASGSAIWMIPALAFTPAMGGPLSMDAGLALLVASAVNVHHFILDGAIWKLRGRIADLLIRDVSADRAPGGGTLLRRVVWGACGLAVAAQIFQLVNVDRVRFADDLDRRTSALDRLAWLGLDSAGHRFRFGSAYLRRGEGAAAVEQLERASALSEAPRTWGALGLARIKTGDRAGALEALDRATELSPGNADLHRARAIALRELGRPAEAAAALDRAAELAPDGRARGAGS